MRPPIARILVGVALLCACTRVGAQLHERAMTEDYRPDTTQARALQVEVDALAFFHDNEYDSPITRGYSLPGAWVTPRLTYNPIAPLHLELGARALLFNGANKYPSYAYHDIGTWKGHQYQRGMHILPWFRATAQLRNLTLVLGDIYGGSNHRLITPLYNAEHNLSADPEMGFQLLLDRPHIHLDSWIDWQSYIFEEDDHQEAFTVGTTARILWDKGKAPVRLFTPVQLTIQHRGGEQDTTSMGVQTLCNYSVGLGVEHTTQRPVLNRVRGEVDYVGCLQQSGSLWPFDAGSAIHCSAELVMWHRLELTAGYLYMPGDFQSLYGSPFFSTQSIKNPGLSYQRMHTEYARLTYTHTFTPQYHIGAMLEVFQQNAPGLNDLNFSFGVYLRATPRFLIKKW